MKTSIQNLFIALVWLALALVAVPLAAKAQYTFIDLNPSGFSNSYATGISGGQQVGYGYTNGVYHALLWSGTAASAVDLNPSGFTYSQATAISGSHQVGYGSGAGTGGNDHPLLWSGTAASAFDLNPSGFTYSYALGISGTLIAGYGFMGGNSHALLWLGPSGNRVDLNPSGFTYSYALGISGIHQVGFGGVGVYTQGLTHALLWSGTANGVVDLNPSGFGVSHALGISGNQQVQVGYGTTNGVYHALLWSGTAASAVDLQSFLSTNYISSKAQGIDANGNIVGYAYNSSTGQNDAILWVATPYITSILHQGTNILITWTTHGGTTNVVQASNGGAGGSYSNNFTDLSPPMIIPGTGLVTTNYTDTNGATNKSRFYRIKITYPSP